MWQVFKIWNNRKMWIKVLEDEKDEKIAMILLLKEKFTLTLNLGLHFDLRQKNGAFHTHPDWLRQLCASFQAEQKIINKKQRAETRVELFITERNVGYCSIFAQNRRVRSKYCVTGADEKKRCVCWSRRSKQISLMLNLQL